MKALIVSGFPGTGKSYMKKMLEEKGIIILDSDSSLFSWLEPGIRNPDFPNNYIQHIKENMYKVDIIFISSHESVRNALRENNIKYILVYPDIFLKEEYLDRYRRRNSSEVFIKKIEEDWQQFVEDCSNDHFAYKCELQSGQYMTDVIMYKINHDNGPHIESISVHLSAKNA